MGWSSREWTGFLLRAAGRLTDAPPSATMRRTVRAAAHVKSRCGLRLPCRLPGAFASRHAPVSPLRYALRRGEGAVGGAVRAAVRVFGVAPDGRSAKPCRSESLPTVIPALRRRRRHSILPWQGAGAALSTSRCCATWTAASMRTASPASGARSAPRSICSRSRARRGSCARRARPSGRRRRRRCWRRRCWPTSPTPSGSSSSRRCCGRTFCTTASCSASSPGRRGRRCSS